MNPIQPTEIPIPPVAPKKSNLPLILGGVLVLLLVAAGAVYAGMKIQEKKGLGGLTPNSIIVGGSLTSIPVTCGPCPQFAPPHPDFCKDGTIVPGEKNECGCQMPPTCDKTASWKTYTNTKYGFELKYPSDMLFSDNGGILSLMIPPDTGVLDIFIEKTQDDLNSWWLEKANISDKNLLKNSSNKKPITLFGIDVTEINYKNGGIGEWADKLEYIFKRNDINFRIVLDGYFCDSCNLAGKEDQILSTFKFLE